jgi:hypothetical protein
MAIYDQKCKISKRTNRQIALAPYIVQLAIASGYLIIEMDIKYQKLDNRLFDLGNMLPEIGK